MKRVVLIFCLVFFLLPTTGCSDSSAQMSNTKEAQEVKEQPTYVKISKKQLLGTWKCSRYVLGNGMEQEFMAKRLPEVTFREDKVTYMMQDYDYKIKDGKVTLTSGDKSVGATPFVYDGKFLVQVGDNAKIFYEKNE